MSLARVGFDSPTKLFQCIVVIILGHGGWLQEGGRNWAGRGGT